MPFGQPRLLLSLTPSQIDAALVVGKRIRASKRAKVSPAIWEEAWGDGLSAYDVTLGSLIKSLGVGKNTRTSVLYGSPGSVTVVRSAPTTGDAGVDAARLEVVENVVNSGLEYISCATRLDHDEGANVLVSADRDLNAQTVFAWLSRAGCRLEALVPMRAIALRKVIRDVTSREDDGTVTCYLGERTTVIASGGGGVLSSVRSIDFGFSLLVEAFARGLRQDVEEGGSADVCMNHAEARERLFAVGLPTGAGSGVEVSRSVLPLLQPVLQRYCIEIKQTIRFGMPEEGSGNRTLRLVGPGAAIRGFVDPLSQSIDNEVHVDPSWAKFDPDSVCSDQSLEQDFIQDDVPELRLTPRIVREQNASRQITAGIRAGVLCAGLALAAEGGIIYSKKADVSRSVSASEPSLASVREHRSQCEQAGAMAVSFESASELTLEHMEHRPDWYALLGELASVGGDSISMAEIRVFREDARVQVAVVGRARLGAEHGNALGDLTEKLRASPLFRDVQLGSTSLVESGGQRSRRFELRLTPHLFNPTLSVIDDAFDQNAEVTP